MASLEINDVRKQLGGREILNGINIELEDGEFLVLLGPSGCGKSTLLNMIAGLDTIDSGEVRIGATRVNEVHPRDRNIAMVFQSYALYPSMNVARNITFGLERRGVKKDAQIKALKDVSTLLQIENLLDRKPSQLSGGQRQRVAMGRALVRDPKIFLFDEPLSNLDAKLRTDMRTEIKRLHQRLKSTIVYVTHDQVEAMTLATRVAVMCGGEIQQYAEPQTIYEKPANMFVAGFIGSPSMNFIPAVVIQDDDGTLQLAIQKSDAANGVIKMKIENDQSNAANWVGRDVILGVRPEAIVRSDLNGAQADPVGSFDVVIEVVEPTGADTMVVFELGGKEVTARLAPRDVVPAGQTMPIKFKMDQVNLFDPETTNRI